MPNYFLAAATRGAWVSLLLSSAFAASAVPVTFQVNLRVQTELGRFHPETDTVEGRGSFNVDVGGAWLGGFTLTNSPTDTNVYLGIYDITTIAPGAPVAHKFVISSAASGLVWEGNVGVGQADRAFILATTDQTLPVAFFDNLTNRPGAGISVTFQLNMAVPIARGAFNPVGGVVEVRGPFHNNWGAGLLMTNSSADPNLYLLSVNISTIGPGSSVPYKYALNGGVTWDSGADRTFTLAGSDQTLALDYFDRLNNFGALSLTATFFDVTLSWVAGPGIRLQSTSDQDGGQWLDVPDTQGQSSATVAYEALTDGHRLFRLTGP